MKNTRSTEIAIDNYEQIEAMAAQGLSQEQICRVLGISPGTLYSHRKKNEELAECLKRGRAKGLATITSALFRSARDGNIVAIKYYLSNRDSKRWYERKTPPPELEKNEGEETWF